MPVPKSVELNKEQKQAVEYHGSPLIVLAGPGTGKTRVITNRVAYLINDKNIQPENILALTFTNKAAEEMRNRLSAILGSTSLADRVTASTFHGFGLRLIQRFADLAGMRSSPQLIDVAQQKALLRKIIDDTKIGYYRVFYDPYSLLSTAIKFISTARNMAVFPENALTYIQTWQNDLKQKTAADEITPEQLTAQKAQLDLFSDLAQLYEIFEKKCLEKGWATFDDYQTQPLRLLRSNNAVRSITRSDYSHIVVDEFQDVNLIQFELLKCLAGPNHDICVVGDDDQAIYGFRGSMPRGFTKFKEHWTQTKIIELTKNYRSSSIILDLAHHIVHKCESRFYPDKKTVAAGNNAACKLPASMISYTGLGGAGNPIGSMILNKREKNNDLSWSDFAVLCRNKTDASRISSVLDLMEIPYEMPEQPKVFEHPAVRDVMSWLHVLHEPGAEDEQLIRLLVRPPYGMELLTLVQWQREYHQQIIKAATDAAAQQSQNSNDENAPEIVNLPFIEQLIQWNRHDAISQFASHYKHLKEFSLTETVDKVVAEIIYHAQLLTVEPEDTLAHTVRVEHLGQFLGFVRERVANLEPPRRISQFLQYLVDLSDPHSGQIPISVDNMFAGSTEYSDNFDAVRILTAHKSKGLEFDTVFISHINKRHGFDPAGSLVDEQLIPVELIDGGAGGEIYNKSDEERRLFFVAMTRAKRQIVLLARADLKQAPPSDFWFEVEQAANENDLPVNMLNADDLHKINVDNSRNAAYPTIAETGLSGPCPVRHNRKTAVFHNTVRILDKFKDPMINPDNINELIFNLNINVLQSSLLVARDEKQIQAILDNLPPSLAAQLKPFAHELTTSATGTAGSYWSKPLPNPQPPLKLSYSAINLYNRCPRCYWLRYVVGLRPVASSAATFGQIIHAALEGFYRKQMEAPDEEYRELAVEDIIKQGQRAYEAARPPEEMPSEEFRECVKKALTFYFEKMHSPDINPIATEKTIFFDYPRDGINHRIESRIDRIDSDDKGFTLVDYKTHGEKKEYLKPSGTDLQFGIYLMALKQWADTDDVAGTAQYWMTSTGSRGIIDFTKIKLDKVCLKIDKVIDGILNGDWQRGRECNTCELICNAVVSENDYDDI